MFPKISRKQQSWVKIGQVSHKLKSDKTVSRLSRCRFFKKLNKWSVFFSLTSTVKCWSFVFVLENLWCAHLFAYGFIWPLIRSLLIGWPCCLKVKSGEKFRNNRYSNIVLPEPMNVSLEIFLSTVTASGVRSAGLHTARHWCPKSLNNIDGPSE